MSFIKNAYSSNGTYVASSFKVNTAARLATTYDGVSAVVLDLATSGASAGTYGAVAVDTYGRVTSGLTMTATGDVSGTSSGAGISLTLANSGVTAGTYNTITVNQKGLVTAASNTAYVLSSLLGANSGVATLDGGGKLTGAQIPASLVGAVVYQGTWNATTNTPALASGTGTKGFYYKVSVSGATSLDGITQWNAGDTVIFDGTTWDKIDGVANEVLSVNGQTGVVSITSVTGNAGTATKLASAQTIALSGDATGSTSFDGSTGVTITTTLANSGVGVGTYSAVAVNQKGLVTAGVNMTATGDATGTAVGASIALTLANSGATLGTYSALVVNAKGIVTSGVNMTATGDATGTAVGSAIALTLAASGATLGTYSALVVNAKGIVTSGVNMTATGDATGTAVGSAIALTLASVGSAGTYASVVTDAKGRVVSGTGGWSRTAVSTATYTVAGSDTYLGVSATATTAVVLTLPAGSAEGRNLFIKDEGGNAFINTITVNTSAPETIDGTGTMLLNVNYEGVHLIYSNSKWWVF